MSPEGEVAAGAREAAPHELFRPALHAATGLCALLLGVLPHGGAIACGIGGVLIGWIGFPLTGLERKLRRPGERYLAGLRTYPVAVLGLILLLPPLEAAAAWGVVAFGDAAAALVGRSVKAPPVFGHPKATWSGSVAHVVFGGAGALALSRGAEALGVLTASGVEATPAPSVLACFLAALAAALLDLVLRVPDDNIPGAAAAGAVLVAARGLL